MSLMQADSDSRRHAVAMRNGLESSMHMLNPAEEHACVSAPVMWPVILLRHSGREMYTFDMQRSKML